MTPILVAKCLKASLPRVTLGWESNNDSHFGSQMPHGFITEGGSKSGSNYDSFKVAKCLVR